MTGSPPKPGQDADDASADELLDSLVQTSFLLTAALSRVGAAYDLSLTQLRVLGILRDRRVRMSALADHLGLERSTMSGLVDRAEARGLVLRAPSPGDRRAIDVFLSADGIELAGRVYADLMTSMSTLTRPLPGSDRRRLGGLLRRVLDSPVEGGAGSGADERTP